MNFLSSCCVMLLLQGIRSQPANSRRTDAEFDASMQGQKTDTNEGNVAERFFEDSCECERYNLFCASDGSCRTLTCENIFNYGPSEVSGINEYGGGQPRALDCTHNPDGFLALGQLPPISFLCLEENTGSITSRPISDEPFLPFSRKCTASTPKGGEFQCFDMRHTTSDELLEFKQTTKSIGFNCSAEEHSFLSFNPDAQYSDNYTYYRRYVYESYVGSQKRGIGGGSKHHIVQTDYRGSPPEDLDFIRARAQIFSFFKEGNQQDVQDNEQATTSSDTMPTYTLRSRLLALVVVASMPFGLQQLL